MMIDTQLGVWQEVAPKHWWDVLVKQVETGRDLSTNVWGNSSVTHVTFEFFLDLQQIISQNIIDQSKAFMAYSDL